MGSSVSLVGNVGTRSSVSGSVLSACGRLNANDSSATSLAAAEAGTCVIAAGGGGGWDHPIHLHFEEGVTINRGTDAIPATERLVRKDVWRLRSTGQRTVTFQIQFGEYGGSYVNHCHNTVHEDFALLMRIQLLTGVAGSPQTAVTPTPNPTPDGVIFTTPEILPEGDPRV